VRLSLKLGLLLVSVVTVSASWNGVGGANVQNRLVTAKQSAGQSSVSVHSGYGGNEVFCAPQPLSGTLTYRVSSGRASVGVAIRSLPRSTRLGIDWSNNAVRGYLIGTVRSDGRGDSIPGSLRLFRPAESQGYKVVLTWPDNDPLATMWPCRSPAAETLQCERGLETRLPIASRSIKACLSGQLTVRYLCPPPSSTVFVIWHGRTYVLSEGHQPDELPQQYGMGAISEAYGLAGSSSQTSTPAGLPTTTGSQPSRSTTTTE